MKCYNCDSIIEMQSKCPVCNVRIDRSEYELESTKKILDKIENIKNFANFIGLFYIRSFILLTLAIISIGAGIYFYVTVDTMAGLFNMANVLYMVLAFVAIVCFNFFLEMRKVEKYYADFKKGKNTYYILWPIKTEVRTFFCDANENILNKEILNKRYHGLEKRGKEETFLRFNSFRLLHPQKPKLFMEKDFFYQKFFGKKPHYIKTHNYNDESYVAVEGTVHGFLVMDTKVITIFNTPRLTKKFLNNDQIKELELSM